RVDIGGGNCVAEIAQVSHHGQNSTARGGGDRRHAIEQSGRARRVGGNVVEYLGVECLEAVRSELITDDGLGCAAGGVKQLTQKRRLDQKFPGRSACNRGRCELYNRRRRTLTDKTGLRKC